jgi:hypothetical protein
LKSSQRTASSLTLAARLLLLHFLVVAALLAAVVILSNGAISLARGGHAVEAILLTVNRVNIVHKSANVME